MKKRSFFLIEVLIALFFISICLIPFVEQPISLFRQEIQKIEELELELLANQSFATIAQQLYANSIPWEKIPIKGEKYLVVPLSKENLQIKKTNKIVTRQAYVKTESEKISKQERLPYRLITVNIELSYYQNGKKKIKKYPYHVLAKKIS